LNIGDKETSRPGCWTAATNDSTSPRQECSYQARERIVSVVTVTSSVVYSRSTPKAG